MKTIKIASLFVLNIFSNGLIYGGMPNNVSDAINFLKNSKIDVDTILSAEPPRSFEYSAIFGDIISRNLDKEKLCNNIKNYLTLGLWLFKQDESLDYDIDNIIAYLKELPVLYSKYDFDPCLSQEEVQKFEDSYSEISESHSHSSSEASSEPSSPEKQTSGSKLIELK